MDRNRDAGGLSLPPELDSYVQDSILHMLKPCSCQEHLQQKLAEAEDSQRQMQLHVHKLLRRLEETEVKCAKSRDEAALNAQALRRQVADGQKVAAHSKTLTQECEALSKECARLENECNLYHNDREVFMEAADEAEDRAAAAEERAIEAERRVEELLQEIEDLKKYTPQKQGLETSNSEDVDALKLKVAEVENELQRLQEETEANAKVEVDAAYKQMDEQTTKMQLLLTAANQKYDKTLSELQKAQESCMKMEATSRDEKTVQRMVSSAISAGVYKALEQDRDDAITSLNLQFKGILKRMKGEMRANRERLLKRWNDVEGGQERMKVAEKGMKSLLLEAHTRRKEMSNFKGNLEEAQDQVQLLKGENQGLRLILRAKHNSRSGLTGSPTAKGIKETTITQFKDMCDVFGQDHPPVGPPVGGAARRPLAPLRTNSPNSD